MFARIPNYAKLPDVHNMMGVGIEVTSVSAKPTAQKAAKPTAQKAAANPNAAIKPNKKKNASNSAIKKTKGYKKLKKELNMNEFLKWMKKK